MNTAAQQKFRFAFMFLFVVFILMSLGSKEFGWMRNETCLPYLGCNIGFFGYDALVHFVSGITIAVGLSWLARKHHEWSLFHGGFWKNVLVIMALAALIGVTWEMLEFIFDHVRMDLFHMNLVNPNVMSQASDSDTMGDLSFGLLGAFLSSCVFLIQCPHGKKDEIV